MKSIDLEAIPKLVIPAAKDIPLYVQVYDMLYELIASGVAAPGTIIPGENALVAHLGISRGTIRTALRFLEEDGMVIKRQGYGSVVASRADRQNSGLQRYSNVCTDYCTEEITEVRSSHSYTGSGNWMAQQLRIPCSSVLLCVETEYLSGNTVVAFRESFLPVQLIEQYGIDAQDGEALAHLALETINSAIAQSQAEIVVKTDSIPEAIEERGVPIISVSEIAYDGNAKPLAHFKNYIRNDCFRLHLTRQQRIY